MRRYVRVDGVDANGFQSTHPVWGATGGGLCRHGGSIHFNPRTPCGVRRVCAWGPCGRMPNFNPRTPCGVRLMGALTAGLLEDFNPRTPCGVRRHVGGCQEPDGPGFQSTHPVWGATVHKGAAAATRIFQSTHPVWGATPGRRWKPPEPPRFQSTHPVWGATRPSGAGGQRHADFNPRTPCGVRLEKKVAYKRLVLISIHAPRVGCDLHTFRSSLLPVLFQSTHPVWGATLGASAGGNAYAEFQSTHPVWGATALTSGTVQSAAKFQSTHPVWGATT